MSKRTVYVVVFEPLDINRAGVGGFDWHDNLRDAQKQWRHLDAQNDSVDPTHRARLFEFEVNSLSTKQEITDACELEFQIDDTRLVPLRDTYKVIPNEQLVATIYRLPGNEGTVYTLRLPKGDEFFIGETQPEYHELAAILDEEWVAPVEVDHSAVAKNIALRIDAALTHIRAGKGDPLAALEQVANDLRALGGLS